MPDDVPPFTEIVDHPLSSSGLRSDSGDRHAPDLDGVLLVAVLVDLHDLELLLLTDRDENVAEQAIDLHLHDFLLESHR